MPVISPDEIFPQGVKKNHGEWSFKPPLRGSPDNNGCRSFLACIFSRYQLIGWKQKKLCDPFTTSSLYNDAFFLKKVHLSSQQKELNLFFMTMLLDCLIWKYNRI